MGSLPVHNEATPLLPPAEEEEAVTPLAEPQDSVSAAGEHFTRKGQLRVTVLIFVLLIFTNTFGLLQSSAQVQLFENIYCSEYYTGHPSSAPPADEGSCKIEVVQAHVSSLRGWKSFFDFLPGRIITQMKRYGPLMPSYPLSRHFDPSLRHTGG